MKYLNLILIGTLSIFSTQSIAVDVDKTLKDINNSLKKTFPKITLTSKILNSSTISRMKCKKPVLDFDPYKIRLGNNTIIKITCPYNNASYNIILQLYATGSFYKATSSIKKGEYIKNSKVFKTSVDIKTGRLSNILNKNPVGMISKRYIRRGSIINKNYVEKSNLINKGDTIMIVYKKNGISLEIQGQALSKGNINDIIYFKTSSKTKKRGRVVGKNKIEVEEL